MSMPEARKKEPGAFRSLKNRVYWWSSLRNAHCNSESSNLLAYGVSRNEAFCIVIGSVSEFLQAPRIAGRGRNGSSMPANVRSRDLQENSVAWRTHRRVIMRESLFSSLVQRIQWPTPNPSDKDSVRFWYLVVIGIKRYYHPDWLREILTRSIWIDVVVQFTTMVKYTQKMKTRTVLRLYNYQHAITRGSWSKRSAYQRSPLSNMTGSNGRSLEKNCDCAVSLPRVEICVR